MKIVKPMLLTYQDEVESNPDYLYEPKFDGFRLLVGNDYSYTRHGTITTSRLPELLFNTEEVLLDGELIAPGVNSPDDFAKAMSRFSGNLKQPIIYKAFDILSYKGKSVTSLSIQNRKEILTEQLQRINSPFIESVPFLIEEGAALFNIMKENNMEGMIAKRLNSTYTTGIRSNDWRKIICWSFHDCIVSKITFGPLTVQLESKTGDYIGSVTIGFTKEIRKLLISKSPPFSCAVKARGWTSGGRLRLPQIISI